MVPNFRIPPMKMSSGGMVVAGIIFTVVFVLSLNLSALKSSALTKLGAKPNLLTLIGELQGTTDEMLANTKQLHQQVQTVQSKLSELSAQEHVLQKQTKTGQELEAALQTQVKLTEHGVHLMRIILDWEKQSVAVTGQLSYQSVQLADSVDKNGALLKQLIVPLNRIAQQSDTLSGQMDRLLAELAKSEDSFKLFGKVNSLLKQLPVPLPLPGSGASLLPQIPQDPPQTNDSSSGGLDELLPLPKLPF